MDQIGKYEILDQLGQGGMGAVYRGRDTVIGRDVAIKVINEQALQDPTLKQRFYREARSAGRLSHPNVTTIYDIGEEDGKPFLVMEYLEGKDLRYLLNAIPPPSLADTLAIAVQIGEGLRYAHEQGIIHRDIKPENIRVLSNGHVKIMDFGIARIQNETQALTQTNMSLGTPRYMSPEQIQGEHDIDHRTDIFSFGVLFYELLMGNNPFSGDRITTIIYKILSTEPKPLTISSNDIAKELQPVVSRCLAKRPQDRYPDFGAVLRDLKPIATRHAKNAPTVPLDMSATTPAAPDDTLAAGIAVEDKTLAAPPPQDATVPLSAQDDTVPLPASSTDEIIATPAPPVAKKPPASPSGKPAPREATKRPTPAPAPAPSKSNTGLMAGVGVLLALVLIVGGYYLFGAGDNATSQADPTAQTQTQAQTPSSQTTATGEEEPAITSFDRSETTQEMPAASDADTPPPATPAGSSNDRTETTPPSTADQTNRADNTDAAPTTPPPTKTPEPVVTEGQAAAEIVRLNAKTGTDAASGAESSGLPQETIQQLPPSIQLLTQDLKNYLEQEDNNGLRAMMYRGWESFFESADAIKATVRSETPALSGNRATVVVHVDLTYHDADNQTRQRSDDYTWTLQYMNDDWMLTRVAPR